MRVHVMLFQDVSPEIAVKISPHRVDVIGLVLNIVVLDEESWPLYAIVMGFSYVCRSCPRKLYIVHACLAQLLPTATGYVSWHILKVFVYDSGEAHKLAFLQLTYLDPLGLQRCDGFVCASINIFRRLVCNDSYFPLCVS